MVPSPSYLAEDVLFQWIKWFTAKPPGASLACCKTRGNGASRGEVSLPSSAIPSPPLPSHAIPLEVGPLKPATGSGSVVSFPGGVPRGGALAENEFGEL